ncbi:hypothetical protein F441_23159 [Phytophthora nicotianae CJ01A1]|uniref:RXLR phytopathogen effector protein WY-domain domain-containing protein n=2 Tax=Phytophthora nicotianae TaxID=4792 RepID=W2VMD5_PHYNI|nr:hypothetical protein L915_03653 [Phytophthora nicotianae]ETO99429.1 hypothetical protein F441_23159 [Phytophthora nicotianae CJ01A1]
MQLKGASSVPVRILRSYRDGILNGEIDSVVKNSEERGVSIPTSSSSNLRKAVDRATGALESNVWDRLVLKREEQAYKLLFKWKEDPVKLFNKSKFSKSSMGSDPNFLAWVTYAAKYTKSDQSRDSLMKKIYSVLLTKTSEHEVAEFAYLLKSVPSLEELGKRLQLTQFEQWVKDRTSASLVDDMLRGYTAHARDGVLKDYRSYLATVPLPSAENRVSVNFMETINRATGKITPSWRDRPFREKEEDWYNYLTLSKMNPIDDFDKSAGVIRGERIGESPRFLAWVRYAAKYTENNPIRATLDRGIYSILVAKSSEGQVAELVYLLQLMPQLKHLGENVQLMQFKWWASMDNSVGLLDDMLSGLSKEVSSGIKSDYEKFLRG